METVPTVDVALNPPPGERPVPDSRLLRGANARAMVAIGVHGLYVAWLVALFAGEFIGYALPDDLVIQAADIGLSLGMLVAFLFWKWSAYRLAMQFSADPLESTPGWAVAVYFIPIANLWMPYTRVQEVREVLEDSGGALEYGRSAAPSHGFVLAWWLLWIFAPITVNLLGLGDPSGVSYAWVIGVGMTLASNLFSMALVLRMNEAAQQLAASRGAEVPAPLFG
mgnify:CR=1 FL=1